MSESSDNHKLTRAYDQMLEQIEREVLPNLQRSIEQAAEKAVDLGELTREEAQMIGGYLKRDLEDVGHHLATTGHDLGAWLRFDLELIENRLLELFQTAADKTRLEMLSFQEEVERATHYHSGEITGPGTLQCDNCGKQLHFHATTHIPPCSHCQTTTFTRLTD